MKAQILVGAFLVYGFAGAAGATPDNPSCDKALSRVVQAKSGNSVVIRSRSLQELFDEPNMSNMSGRELAILAKAVDYDLRREAGLVAGLVDLGVPKSEVLKFARPLADDSLTKLEEASAHIEIPVTTTPQLTYEKDQKKVGTSEQISVQKFIDRHQLASTLDFARVLEKERRRDTIKAQSVMENAFMMDDPEFTARAIKIGLKYEAFDKLIKMASKAKHNKTLLLLGRIGISRYFLTSNSNWASEGISALSFLTGSDREYSKDMLYDLFDLLSSPGIRSKLSGEDLDSNLGVSMRVLMATQDTIYSGRWDSSERFVHRYARTSDLRFVSRVQSTIDEIIRLKKNIYLVDSLTALVDSREFHLALAAKAKVYVAEYKDDREKEIFEDGSKFMNIHAILMSGDESAILQYLREAVKVLRVTSQRNREELITEKGLPESTLNLLKRIIQNPKLIDKDTTAEDIKSISEYFEDAKPREVKYWSKFQHEKGVLENGLKRGENMTPEEAAENKARAAEMISIGRYFYAIAPLMALRDVAGMRDLYAKTLKYGRALDAVYVALGIEWLETGKSPFDQFDTSSNQIEEDAVKQLE